MNTIKHHIDSNKKLILIDYSAEFKIDDFLNSN